MYGIPSLKHASFTVFSISESSPSQPQYVFWYHNDRMVNYDTERGVRLTYKYVEQDKQKEKKGLKDNEKKKIAVTENISKHFKIAGHSCNEER